MACASCSQPLPDGAKFCPFCGQQVAIATDEERRLITVLFADIVGYTGLVEYLDPERVKRLLDDAFQRLIGAVVDFGGTVDKVLGDGVLALFGAPVAHEDDPDRAIRAALQMHRSLEEFMREHEELERPVQLRVGVNTGEVLFGRVGGTDDYTVMGDVVNVASRLQALAPAGAVYVGDSTAALASPEIVLERVDDLDVRGREQSETVWRVVGHRPRSSNRGVLRNVPFVGRADQRELLASILHMVASGRSAVVAVSGEAGSGKTRLITEALEGADAAGVAVLAGHCVPYGEDNVWAPIAMALFGRVDVAVTGSADRLRELTVEHMRRRYGFQDQDPLLDWLVEGVLHVGGHPSRLDDMSPSQARETLFRLIVEILRRRTLQQPIVLWIDDLQWASSLLLDLLHRIARSLVDRPLLLLTAHREGAEIEWPPHADHPVTVHMPLDALSSAEADELVQAVMGEAPEPLLARQLYERSGGNPLFLTELATIAAADPDSSALPGSLRVLIAARLDRLPPLARAVVDNAAVLGSSGPLESLETFAHEMGQPFRTEDLEVLERSGLLEIQNDRWRFRSDVVREVAYQTLTKLARAERHTGVAMVMATSGAGSTAQIANHAASAAELLAEIGPIPTVPPSITARAIEYLTIAARRALDVGAFTQARRHATRALDLGPTDDQRLLDLLLLRAAALTELRDFGLAQVDTLAALDLATDLGDIRSEGVARRLRGAQAQGSGDLGAARRELDHSIEIFRDLGDRAELASTLADRGFAEIFGGSLQRADVFLDESEALADDLGDRRARAWARQHKAMVSFLSGDADLATKRLDAAAHEFDELGDRAGLSWAHALSAYVAFYQRRFADAEAMAQQARSEAAKLGERWAPAMMDSLLASLRLWSGNFAEAEELSRRALTRFRELGDRFGTVQALSPHMRSLVALGRVHEAERAIEEALALSDSFGSLAFPAMAAAGAAVHLGIGDGAVVIGETAVGRTVEMGANGSESRVTLALALLQSGRADEALGELLGVDVELPYAHAVQALALTITGDPRNAIAEADLVAADHGSSYLDRVIADLAAAASELALGDEDQATMRLDRAHEVADGAGDVVARALVAHTRLALLGPAPELELAQLGPGWHTVIDRLAKAAAANATV